MPKLIHKTNAGDRAYDVVGLMLVGRDEHSDIHLPDQTVALKHARIIPFGNQIVLQNVIASNITTVNGKPIEAHFLKDGDEICIGHDRFTFREVDTLSGLATAGTDSSMQGKPFGGYMLEACLGQTQMGDVYRAVERSTNRSVALKILKSEVSSDQAFITVFLDEGREAKRLSHPGLVRYLDFGVIEGQLCYSMEYFDGQPIQHRIKAEGPWAWKRVIDVGLQVSSALAHLADAGRAHLNLHPMNIMIDKDNRVKLVGLGMTQWAIQRMGGIHQPQILTGDPHYMAPEQHLKEPVDPRADIYALGASMHFLLTGNPPFTGPLLTVIARHKIEQRPDSCRFDKSIPNDLSALLRRMMAIDPKERPSKPGEIVKELEKLKDTGRATRPLEVVRSGRLRAIGDRAAISDRNRQIVRTAVSPPAAKSTRSLRPAPKESSPKPEPAHVFKYLLAGGLLLTSLAVALVMSFMDRVVVESSPTAPPTTAHTESHAEGVGSTPPSSGAGAGSSSSSAGLSTAKRELITNRLAPAHFDRMLNAKGEKYRFIPVEQVRLPEGKSVTVKCLLCAKLDPFTEQQWKRAGMLKNETVVTSPFLRTVTLSEPEHMNRLLDWHVQAIAITPETAKNPNQDGAVQGEHGKP